MIGVKDRSLCFICTEEYGNGVSVIEAARLAIQGGVDILQMREKHRSRDELIRLGSELSRLCKEKGTLFVVNDDPFLAARVSAGGVHLGQEDLKSFSVERTRDILGPGKIIGVSTHSPAELELADKSDVDYIAFGPIFPTQTKDYSIGLGEVENVLRITGKPVVFIGGITLDNVGLLLDKGAKNIAVIRDIIRAEDIEGRVRVFKQKMKK